jgi:hypothetical protein
MERPSHEALTIGQIKPIADHGLYEIKGGREWF